jgi:photosystem II stability/assembly factor-like uncharacterized protein
MGLCLFNSDNVLGVGSGRKIIRTTNGGTNWLSATAGTYSNNLYSVSKLSNTTAIAVGDYGIIMKSMNTGANWTNVTSPTTTSLKSVSFSDSLNGTAVGIGGTILKTSNSGNNWSQINTADVTTNDLNCICFLNSNTGIAVGNSGTILKTTNGGINWVQKTSGTVEDLLSVSISNQVCYATIYSGYVLKSTNLGENWTTHFAQTNSMLLSVFFNDANTGWICGTGGTILKTTDGGGVFVSKISSEIPTSHRLFQNYPNPFNAISKIKYQIGKMENGKWKTENGMVTLKIFDVTGKEVMTLVNETQNAGTYEVTFEGSNLASGIYFYQLKTDNFIETKKLILLK